MFLRTCAVMTFVGACASDDLGSIDETIVLTVENRTGAQMWRFQYSGCGEDDWNGVIASDEYVSNGSDVSSADLEPGCYDLYVEDEFACWSENSTNGNIPGGREFIWTVTETDLACP